MARNPDNACARAPMQLAAWAEDQGITLDEMRTRVAGNREAMEATAARMARMVEEASRCSAPDQAQPRKSQD